MMKAIGSCLSPSCRRSVALVLDCVLVPCPTYLLMSPDLSSADNHAVYSSLDVHIIKAIMKHVRQKVSYTESALLSALPQSG